MLIWLKKMGHYKLNKLQNSFKAYIKMDKKKKCFGDTEIENHKFHQHKSSILINNIDINKVVVSKKISFSKKGKGF